MFGVVLIGHRSCSVVMSGGVVVEGFVDGLPRICGFWLVDVSIS